MLHLRRARIPAALLPPALIPAEPDPLDPTVLCDISVQGGVITEVSLSGPEKESSTDLGGALVCPSFVDAHVHLDKTHTWFRTPNRNGTFEEALRILSEDKSNWTREDLLLRSDFALRCAWAHGTRVVRTHLDTGLPWGETSHATMAELRQRWKGRIEIQTIPLCPSTDEADEKAEERADLGLRHGASALGGFIVMSQTLPKRLDHLLRVARDRGMGVDFHTDENANATSEVLQAVAEAVLRSQFPHPVVCGHCCSLSRQSPKRQRETLALVKDAKIGIVSLPQCNMYLQDRRTSGFSRTPQWRGLTLVQEFLDAGIPVAMASDNVRDAFHAFGDYDMAEVFSSGTKLAHLDTRLSDAISSVTRFAADLVGCPKRGRIAPGSPSQLVIFKARSFSELLSRPAAPRRCVDGESIHAPPLPDFEELASGLKLARSL